MLKTIFLLITLPLLITGSIAGQTGGYADSLTAYRTNYVKEHGAVPPKDRDYIRFFPVNEACRIPARFERLYGFGWFEMETSGTIKKKHRGMASSTSPCTTPPCNYACTNPNNY